MKALDEKHTFIARLNVMDDPFFQKIAENPAVCEEILRILLQKPKLKIIQTNTQLFLRNLSAHSVILDALCTDETGAFFNIEIQKDDKKGKNAKARFPQLVKQVKFLKETPEGAMIMGNVFDEYAELKVKEAEKEFQKKIKATKKAARKTTEQALQEKEKATAINFLREGVSVETIAKALPSLSIEFTKQLKQQLPQA